MSKTIILHIPTGKEFQSDDRVTKCPFGKNRKMKPTDSIYNEVCEGCADNYSGWQNSQENIIRCYYEKQKKISYGALNRQRHFSSGDRKIRYTLSYF